MTDSLRIRLAAAIYGVQRPWDGWPFADLAAGVQALYLEQADAVIRELGPIPDRRHVDDQGRVWEWCGGQPGTWAWRITQNGPVDVDDVDVECAVCHRTYSVRSDAPGWSSVWTSCLSCQANEENEWISR